MTSRANRTRRAGTATGILTLAVVLTGCAQANRAGPPVADPVRSTIRVGSAAPVEIQTRAGVGQRTFGAPAERIWALLPEVFETLDIPVAKRDVRAAEFGNEGYLARRVEGKRMSTYVDCGTTLSGVLADTHDITLMALVRVASTEDGGTTVTTFVDATGLARATRGNPIHCQSKNVLEKRVSDLLAEYLVRK